MTIFQFLLFLSQLQASAQDPNYPGGGAGGDDDHRRRKPGRPKLPDEEKKAPGQARKEWEDRARETPESEASLLQERAKSKSAWYHDVWMPALKEDAAAGGTKLKEKRYFLIHL